MRRFSYSINSVYKRACISVEVAPWYIMFLDSATSFVCSHILNLPLPPIPFRLFDKLSIDINQGRKWAKLNEWYGGLNDIFCCHVHNYIGDFCFRRMEFKQIDISYDEAKRVFYGLDKIFWDEQEKMNVDKE